MASNSISRSYFFTVFPRVKWHLGEGWVLSQENGHTFPKPPVFSLLILSVLKRHISSAYTSKVAEEQETDKHISHWRHEVIRHEACTEKASLSWQWQMSLHSALTHITAFATNEL